jgi:SAM-dependent methyltransferase/ADP-ribose pyrophosphatase YjhB (NUDIX family)
MTATLLEKNERVLVVRRRRSPFIGQYTVPLTVVTNGEAAEEAMRRHASEQFALTLAPDTEQFVETVYLSDGDAQYVANIFRAQLPEGAMRFNADGDYDDARWLGAAELESIAMPPDLRIPLVKILTDPDALHELDWDRMGKELNEQAVPLADRETPPTASAAPDNAAGWNAISKAYQTERYGERDPGRLKWSWGLFEDELRVLDDVRGKRALVLGCGGGQDVVALSKMGALAVGIDISTEQVSYAKKYALRQNAQNASFVEGDMQDLSRFDDASFDLAVSVYALQFVERAGVAIAEAARVLKPGGVLAISVSHPFNITRDEAAPYGIIRPYWGGPVDWRWTFDDKTSAEFRHYRHTTQEWFEMLTGAGFTLERLLEPSQAGVTGDDATALDMRLARLAPYVLILKARKR